ncbi:DUF3040 domain-containing protein [Actinomycetospora sp. NBRC 106378]|uniref:DUF3040 domain-containing protein n=1 Tax=Actinomycetospora sp. NBRC 106378 TaxID=3032208 RepID=UPI0024A19130|nr:DUF3040 domain-containing protein [Actinomycetospora sp. NBRC 106378]GLZ50434.1 hypothetical protein Acsp07_00510 [Actinomycetospora sp. NBRC 106378]
MHSFDEDDQRPDSARADGGRAPVDRGFASLVGTLRSSDPRFARRVSEPHRLRSGQIMTLVAFVVTVLVGLVPLILGIHLQATALLTVGAIGTAFAPVVVPPVVGVILSRLRPLW